MINALSVIFMLTSVSHIAFAKDDPSFKVWDERNFANKKISGDQPKTKESRLNQESQGITTKKSKNFSELNIERNML